MIVTINTNSGASIALRNAPDHEATQVATLANGTKCTADTLTGSWLHVTTPSGQQGYIAAAFADGGIDGLWDDIKSGVKNGINRVKSVAKQAISSFTGNGRTQTMFVTGNGVRLRSEPKADSDTNIVAKLNAGAQVTVTPGKASGSWSYATTADGKQGYISTAYLAGQKPTSANTVTNGGNQQKVAPAQTDAAMPDKTNQESKKMTLSENTRKIIKIGVIGLAAAGIGYGIYKMTKKDASASGSTKAAGLNGVPGRKNGKKRNRNKKGRDSKHKALPF